MAYGSFGVYNNRPIEPIPVRLYATAGTQIRTGYVVAYRVTATETSGVVPGGNESVVGSGETRSDTGSAREYQVEQPSISNIEHIAGVVCDVGPSSGVVPTVGYLDVEIVSFSNVNLAGVEVWTDQSITAGDLLGAQPGSWAARRGVLFGNPLLRAIQTVDRSTTNGTVRGTASPVVQPDEFNRKHLVYDNDFGFYLTAHNGLTSRLDSTGTAAGANTLNGVLVLTTAATDNDVAGVSTTQQLFQLASGNPLYFEARLNSFTENTTNGLNLYAGLSSGVGTAQTVLLNNGATTAATADRLGIAKVDGGAVWRVVVERSGTVSNTALSNTAVAATAYKFGILYNGLPLTLGGGGRVLIFINDTLASTFGSGAETTIPNALMYLNLLVKAGQAGVDTATFDRVRCIQAKSSTAF